MSGVGHQRRFGRTYVTSGLARLNSPPESRGSIALQCLTHWANSGHAIAHARWRARSWGGEMNKFLLASVTAIALAGGDALAADMPTKAPKLETTRAV